MAVEIEIIRGRVTCKGLGWGEESAISELLMPLSPLDREELVARINAMVNWFTLYLNGNSIAERQLRRQFTNFDQLGANQAPADRVALLVATLVKSMLATRGVSHTVEQLREDASRLVKAYNSHNGFPFPTTP